MPRYYTLKRLISQHFKYFSTETIVGMYLYNDSNAVREVFKTKVENCGLIPELDLLEIAKAHGPISSNFKRGKNEINMESFEERINSNLTLEEYMEELAELQKEELSEAEKVVKMIEQMDLNRDGIVGCDEFVVNLANNYLQ